MSHVTIMGGKQNRKKQQHKNQLGNRLKIPQIPEEVVREILSFCNPIELIALQYTSKRFSLRNRIVSAFTRNLDRILCESGYPQSFLCSLLDSNNCCLSGSMVLQAILGVTWKSDIDMYVVPSNEAIVKNKLLKAFPTNNFLPYGSDDFGEHYFFTKLGSEIRSIEWFTPRDGAVAAVRRPLQLMTTRGSVAEHIVRGFDLDIVMNSWNGSTLSIANPEALLSRRATSSKYVAKIAAAYGKCTDLVDEQFGRLLELESDSLLWIDKDRYSGDYWGDDHHMESCLRSVFNTVFPRLQKYKARGFSIMLSSTGVEWTAKMDRQAAEWLSEAGEGDRRRRR